MEIDRTYPPKVLIPLFGLIRIPWLLLKGKKLEKVQNVYPIIFIFLIYTIIHKVKWINVI